MNTMTLAPKAPPAHDEQAAKRLAVLYKISRRLSDGSSQRQTLTDVLEILDSDLRMKRGMIVLLDSERSELLIAVAHNISERERRAVHYRVGEGVVGRVVETGEPVVVPRVSEEPMFLDRLHKRRASAAEEVSFICVPIVIGQKVVGALSVDRVFDASDPLDEVVQILSIVTRIIAYDVKARGTAEAQRRRLEEENFRLRNELEDRFRPENIIGNSGAIRKVYGAIHQVAHSTTTVLILGESGTGKELVAHAIHYASPRAKGPFIKVNCAALSENLLESELFGHERGAFTGAIEARKGRIEEAGGGTLFLDEIGEFSASTQIKLLRVLQDKQFERVGSNRTRHANVRVVTATNRDLDKAVATGGFREDLYYRINVFPIVIPPLSDRKDDIMQLADFFVERYAKETGKNIRRISTPAINMMMAYHWPGNVRELENCIERAVLLSDDDVIHAHHLPPSLQTSELSDTIGTGTLEARVALLEADILVDALKRSGANITSAARELGTTTRIFRYKVQKLGIDPRQFKRQ